MKYGHLQVINIINYGFGLPYAEEQSKLYHILSVIDQQTVVLSYGEICHQITENVALLAIYGIVMT